MATHLTEEEQIEAFKRWWNENWVTIVLPLVAAVFLYVGWYWWKDHKQAQAEIASVKFDEITSIVTTAEAADGLTSKQEEEVVAKAQILLKEHSNTLYADLTQLILASIDVDNGELDKAANTLNEVVQNGTNSGISLLAQARLAKVYLSQGRHGDALNLVSQVDDPAFASMYAEIRGDIHLDQGEIAAANTAYQMAAEKLDPQNFNRSGLLQTKISATRSAPAASAGEQISEESDQQAGEAE